jgi:hypothetical protein
MVSKFHVLLFDSPAGLKLLNYKSLKRSLPNVIKVSSQCSPLGSNSNLKIPKFVAHAQLLSSVAHQKQYTYHHIIFSNVPLCIQPTFTRRTSRHYLRNFTAAGFLPLSRNIFCLSYYIFSDFNVLS